MTEQATGAQHPQPRARTGGQPQSAAVEHVTGAQSLIRSLEEVGADTVFGIPGGCDPPGVRPDDGLRPGPPRPGPPRAGRRARGHRVRAGHRQGRRLHGHLGSRRHQPRHPDRRRRTWTPCRSSRSPARSPPPLDRHGRLPGSRHLRHHDADHEAQLPGHRRRARSRAPSPRPSTSPPPAARARSWSTSPRTRCRRRPPSAGRRVTDLPGYRPVTKPHAKQIREAAKLITEAQPPGALRRRRRPQGQRHRGAEGARRADRSARSPPR